ncbi:MAG TPA: 6-phosphogluconolactonase [Syntrophales bacterium]|nr:6-phosphogluconolactonase [Syntrophales bacterium]HRT61540.1 6-phosphogluconolactonase [Syntrophales bacterium]
MRPQIYDNPDLLALQAARYLTGIARDSVHSSGRFTLALSGGATPRRLYEKLGGAECREKLKWDSIHLFWGDERCVPPDDPGSNYRMARETFIDRVPVPPRNIHRIRGEMKPPEAAALYEKDLKAFFFPDAGESPGIPRFDLILLGLGDDGHTASLFPGASALHEHERWVVACHVDKIKSWRVTLTPRLINAARHILFLVSGRRKARCLKEVLRSSYRPDELPAQAVRPEDGRVTWMVDTEAASLL